MVEIRVAVTDAARLHGLMRRLGRRYSTARLFHSTRPGAKSKFVRSGSRAAFVQVLGAVESWLAEDGPDSARLSIGEWRTRWSPRRHHGRGLQDLHKERPLILRSNSH